MNLRFYIVSGVISLYNKEAIIDIWLVLPFSLEKSLKNIFCTSTVFIFTFGSCELQRIYDIIRKYLKRKITAFQVSEWLQFWGNVGTSTSHQFRGSKLTWFFNFQEKNNIQVSSAQISFLTCQHNQESKN